MNITEIRIHLIPDGPKEDHFDRLRAYASITVEDCLIVHGLKIIEGKYGYFVAMPSRKVVDSCSFCKTKNHVRSKFCNHCGRGLDSRLEYISNDDFYVDVVHATSPDNHEWLKGVILDEFRKKKEEAKHD